MQRYDKLMHLKKSLNFWITSTDYEAKFAASNKEVEDLRKKFVEDELNKLDVVWRTHKEQER